MRAWRRYSARVISYYGASTNANAILLAFYLIRFHHTVIGRLCRGAPRTFFVRGNTSYCNFVGPFICTFSGGFTPDLQFCLLLFWAS